MSNQIYVGIDNGISGGLAALSPTVGAGIICMCTMPIQKTRKGNEINICAVWDFLECELFISRNLSNITVIIEEPGGSKSASAATSMAGSFHALRAMCEIKGVRHLRITPQAWQKPMLNAVAGDTKPAALTKARSLWPQENWLATPRCKTPHSGLVDAALISEYARIKNL
jgi:hypothetical protein